MKYKVGDEVLVKAKITSDLNKYGCNYILAELKKGSFLLHEEDIVQDSDMTADEAWEIAKKILLYPAHGGFNATELEEIFGRTEHLWELTPQEAKAKIEVWEAEKEIKVGDVVKVKNEQEQYLHEAVITRIWEDLSVNIVYDDGTTGICAKDAVKKTGRHIDIGGILKQIGGDE